MKKYILLTATAMSLLLCPALTSAQENGRNAQQTREQDGDEDEDTLPKTVAGKSGAPFPFRVNEGGTEYDLFIDLNEPAVKEKYKSTFLRNKVPYTAAAFEEVILQLVETDAGLARTVITATDDGKVLIGTGNPIYRQNLFSILRPLLQQPGQLDRILKETDPAGMEEEE